MPGDPGLPGRFCSAVFAATAFAGEKPPLAPDPPAPLTTGSRLSATIECQRTEQPLEKYFLTVKHPSDMEPWRALLAQNSPGALPPDIPVFLAQGTDDVIIHPDVTRDYFDRLCKAGSKVRMVLMPNIGHGRAAQASTSALLDWASDRFAGTPAPDDCAR